MSSRFITWVIIGVSFGFTQLWFAFWVVKLFKEKQRILKKRRDAAAGSPAKPSAGDSGAQPGGGAPAAGG
jgi:hypothetical protein